MTKLQEIIKDLTNEAKEQIKEISVDPKDIQEFLDFQANFHTYSINNQLLIYKQRRSAYAVLGFGEIKKKGLKLQKGSKAIKILAPLMFKEKDENGKEEMKIKGFKYVNVFDISQTDMKPEDYPTYFPNKPINFKHENVNLDGLEHGIEWLSNRLSTPVEIDKNDSLRGARGGFFPTSNTILLNIGNTRTQNIKTTIHELAHAKLHNNQAKRKHDSKAIKETQAEMVAYITCKYFGIDTSEYSIEYVANWSEKLTAIDKDELVPVFEDIQKTSKEFIEYIEKEKNAFEKVA